MKHLRRLAVALIHALVGYVYAVLARTALG